MRSGNRAESRAFAKAFNGLRRALLMAAVLLLIGGNLAGGGQAGAAALVSGDQLQLPASGCNRAISLHVLDASVAQALEGRPLPPGHQWLVLTIRIENWMPSDLIYGLDYQEEVLFASLPRQLYLLTNDRLIARAVLPADSELDAGFTLPIAGSQLSGQVAFAVPREQAIHALSLRYYHDQFAAIHADLLTSDPVSSPTREGIQGVPENNLMAMRVHGFDWHDEIGGRSAPKGTRWLSVTLRGESFWALESGDARAFDPDAPLDAAVQVPKVMEYDQAEGLLQVVVDDEHGYVRNPALSSLPVTPAWLPDAWAGGDAVFLVPDDAVKIEVVAHFPSFRGEGLTSDIRPTMRMLLRDGDVPARKGEPVAKIADQPTPVTIHAVRHADRYGDYSANEGETLLLLDLSMRNTSDVGGMMNVRNRFSLVTDAGSLEPLSGYQRGEIPLLEPFWLPAGNRPRQFQLLYRLPAGVKLKYLKYGGVSLNTEVGLSLTGPP